MEISVADAAARLGVSRSRVEQLLRSGSLPGRRVGRMWLVDADAVADRLGWRRPSGRPMVPSRAWGLLDLLDNGSAPWLSTVARSQVRARLRLLAGADGGRWWAALRGRSDVHLVRLHPSGLRRLLAESSVLVAGPARAAELGADLVAVEAPPEIYVRPEHWPELAERWHARPDHRSGNLRVRLPRDVWPFSAGGPVGRAVLAADLLEASEPRAVSAGVEWLHALGARAAQPA